MAGRGSVEQNAKKRRGSIKVCRIFYLEHFIFMSWLIGAFDFL